ncbi:MAG: YcgN family cysteine cluster protein [Pseudomonadota bacterium]
MSQAPLDSEDFWRHKCLEEMNDAEWEALCDGCARCCLIKLQDVDTDEVHYTAMVCSLLDQDACRCTRYPQRHELVPDCVTLDAERAASFAWLPLSCAYRTLAEGRPLAAWHPLVSGDPTSVHSAGISVRGRVVDVADIHEDEHEDMLIRWVET